MRNITANIPDDLYNIITSRNIPIEFDDVNELVTEALKKFIAVETRKKLRERSKILNINKKEILAEIDNMRHGKN